MGFLLAPPHTASCAIRRVSNPLSSLEPLVYHHAKLVRSLGFGLTAESQPTFIGTPAVRWAIQLFTSAVIRYRQLRSADFSELHEALTKSREVGSNTSCPLSPKSASCSGYLIDENFHLFACAYS